jgi:hypothetical protein
MRRKKTTGASQQTLLTIIKSWVTMPCSGLHDHIFGGTNRTGQSEAEAEVGLYNVQLNLIWNIFNTVYHNSIYNL